MAMVGEWEWEWEWEWLCVWLVLLLSAYSKQVAEASPSLNVSETLTANNPRTSSNGIFKFGIFNLNGSTNWYLGIWYANAPIQRAVWIANKDRPLSDSKATFKIMPDGSLLLSHANSSIWFTQPLSPPPYATLILDSGNLVALNSLNKSEILWQSFDEPGDTWLPGMKVGTNKSLVSWTSFTDPRAGPFTLQISESDSESLFLTWKHINTYWQFGKWTGSLFTDPKLDMYNFSSFSNKTHRYITYSIASDQQHNYPHIKLNATGELLQFMFTDGQWLWGWNEPQDLCWVYDPCKAFGVCQMEQTPNLCTCVTGFGPRNKHAWDVQDWSGGCISQNVEVADRLHCDNVEFTKVSVKDVPPGGVLQSKEYSTTESCRILCSQDCSCTAFALLPQNNNCYLWFGDLINLVSGSANNFVFVKVGAVIKKSNLRKVFLTKATIATSVVCTSSLLTLLAMCVWLVKRSSSTVAKFAPPRGYVIGFGYRDISILTDNLSVLMGRGCLGSLFKGKLHDNTMVAVRRLDDSECNMTRVVRGKEGFEREACSLGVVYHAHLVRLLGFCCQNGARILVHEFIDGGSLSSVMCGEEEKLVLDWKTRYSVALGIARGMTYLHHGFREPVLHGRLNPDNVLLDWDYSPKIADFGMTKFLNMEHRTVMSRNTMRYVAPEVLLAGAATTKADVYSYGVILIELMTGKSSEELSFEEARGRGDLTRLVDKRIMERIGNNVGSKMRINKAIMMGFWCRHENDKMRPSMKEVLQVLEGVVDPPPLPPPFPTT